MDKHIWELMNDARCAFEALIEGLDGMSATLLPDRRAKTLATAQLARESLSAVELALWTSRPEHAEEVSVA